MTMPVTEKLIQRQIHNWNSLRRYLRDNREQAPLLALLNQQNGTRKVLRQQTTRA